MQQPLKNIKIGENGAISEYSENFDEVSEEVGSVVLKIPGKV